MHNMSKLRKAAAESGVDLLLIQELLAIGSRVRGFGPTDVVLTGAEQEKWPWAALVVLNRSISMLCIGQLSMACTVCVDLTTHLGPLVVVMLHETLGTQRGVCGRTP
jgi:hypothetical protein